MCRGSSCKSDEVAILGQTLSTAGDGSCTIICSGKKILLAITPRILGLGPWYWVIILSGLGELFGVFITLVVVSQDFEKNLSFR